MVHAASTQVLQVSIRTIFHKKHEQHKKRFCQRYARELGMGLSRVARINCWLYLTFSHDLIHWLADSSVRGVRCRTHSRAPLAAT